MPSLTDTSHQIKLKQVEFSCRIFSNNFSDSKQFDRASLIKDILFDINKDEEKVRNFSNMLFNY